MAHLMSDEYLRCDCGNPDFEEKTVVSFHKALKAREDHMKHEPLQSLEKVVMYNCTACGKTLSK